MFGNASFVTEVGEPILNGLDMCLSFGSLVSRLVPSCIWWKCLFSTPIQDSGFLRLQTSVSAWS